jgi:hypothetical protein
MTISLRVLLIHVLMGLGVLATTLAASAAPPTVQYSPGYDARLAEQRKALAASHQLAPIALPRPHVRKKRHR